MILPAPNTKYKILKQVYESGEVKISDLFRKVKASPKAGYRYVNELLRADALTEQLTGKKPLLRVLKPNFSEAGKACFTLLELQKKADFFIAHRELKGAFAQFEREAKDLVFSALIFGSFARGAETPKSDIDLAVFAKKGIKSKLDKIAEHCFVTLKQSVSIRVFDAEGFIELITKKDAFAMQIVKEHVALLNAQNYIDMLSAAIA